MTECFFSTPGAACRSTTLLCVPSHLLVNVCNLGYDFLSISKSWLSVIGFPNFMLNPFYQFLYLIIWDINLVVLLSFLKMYLFAHSSQFTSWLQPHSLMCTHAADSSFTVKILSFLSTSSHCSKQRTHTFRKTDLGCGFVSAKFALVQSGFDS
jgi:hypothetical protein